MAEYNNQQPILGISSPSFYARSKHVNDENNKRLENRLFPDVDLEPNYDPRPLSTKYMLPPYTGKCKGISWEPQLKYPNYYVETNFNPGNDRAPSNGYFRNVDVETNLRNINQPLHHGYLQGDYQPNLKGDLYNVTVVSTEGEAQPFPNLGKMTDLRDVQNSYYSNPLSQNIGKLPMFNNTRVQLRQ